MINNYFKRVISNRMGLGLVLMTILVVVGWRLLVIACSHTPSHWRAIAAKLDPLLSLGTICIRTKTGHAWFFRRKLKKVLVSFFVTPAVKRPNFCVSRKKKALVGSGLGCWAGRRTTNFLPMPFHWTASLIRGSGKNK